MPQRKALMHHKDNQQKAGGINREQKPECCIHNQVTVTWPFISMGRSQSLSCFRDRFSLFKFEV